MSYLPWPNRKTAVQAFTQLFDGSVTDLYLAHILLYMLFEKKVPAIGIEALSEKDIKVLLSTPALLSDPVVREMVTRGRKQAERARGYERMKPIN